MKPAVKYLLWASAIVIVGFGLYRVALRLGWLNFQRSAVEEMPGNETPAPLVFSITSRIAAISGTTISLEAPPGEEASQILVTKDTVIVGLVPITGEIPRGQSPFGKEIPIKLSDLKVGDSIGAQVLRTSAEQTQFEAVKIQKLPF